MSVLHILSTLVMVILAMGTYFRRKRPPIHWRLMTTAFLIDLGLVLYIEFARGAVEQIPDAKTLLWIHIVLSVSVLVCYVALFVLGSRLLKGHPNPRRTHRNVGITFLTLRSLNYVTSFMI